VSLLGVAVACGLVGLLVGQWWAIIVPVVVWSANALFLVINGGWHGAGWGDFGIAFNVMAAALSMLLAAVGIALRRNATPRRTARPATAD
jgi:hypothetical protein